MQFSYFLTPEIHFKMLQTVCRDVDSGVSMHFRRYTKTGFEPGIKLIDWTADLASNYLEGGYSELYLCLGEAVPKSKDDWDFYERELHNLIEVRGGRMRNNDIQISVLRVLARNSNVKQLYQRLRRYFKKELHQGLYIRNTLYKDVFCSKEPGSYKMPFDFDASVSEKEYVRKST